MADVRARTRQISGALTPSEWARAGGMAATVIALHVAGWGNHQSTSVEISGSPSAARPNKVRIAGS